MTAINEITLNKILHWSKFQQFPSCTTKKNLPPELSSEIEDDFRIFINGEGKVFYVSDRTETYDVYGNKIKDVYELTSTKRYKLKVKPVDNFSVDPHKEKSMIEKEVFLAKKAGLLYSNDYIVTGETEEAYQILNDIPGKSLFASGSNLPGVKFSPFALTNHQKIDLAIKIIKQANHLHNKYHVLHRNLHPDNIIIQEKNGSHSARIVGFEQAVPLTIQEGKLVYYGPSLESLFLSYALREDKDPGKLLKNVVQQPFDDIKQLLETLQSSLDITHPAILSTFKSFQAKQDGSREAIHELINQLNACRDYPAMGMELFRTQSYPDPKITGKNILYICVKNAPDGVGDFMHAWEYAQFIKTQVKKSGYEIHALIETLSDEANPDSVRHKGHKFVQEMLARDDTPFDHKLVYTESAASMDNPRAWFYTPQSDLADLTPNEYLQNQADRVAGMVWVSLNGGLEGGATRNLPKVHSVYWSQYGAGQYMNNDISSNIFVCLDKMATGIPDADSRRFYGIKFGSNTFARRESAKDLLALHKSESEFVSQMLESQNPMETDAKRYLQTHRFMPGYLQTKGAATAFILSHYLQYSEDQKCCDFLLPKAVVDSDLIINILEKTGLNREDILIIKPGDSIDPTLKPKVRIFVRRIQNDDDYQTLFKISEDGAGCSGDNSISLVFSSQHLPFYEFKSFIIGQVYQKLLTYIDTSMQESRVIYDTELQIGLRQLKDYFLLLNDLRKVELDAYSQQGNEDQNEYTLQEPEKAPKDSSYLQEDAFYEYCSKLALCQKGKDIRIAWGYITDKLKSNFNLTNQFHNIAKCTLYTSQEDDVILTSILKKSAEIQSLLIEGVIEEEQLNNLPRHMIILLAHDKVQTMLREQWVSIDILNGLWNTPESASIYSYLGREVDALHKKMNDINKEYPSIRSLISQSLPLTLALTKDILTFDVIKQYTHALSQNNVAQWPNIIGKPELAELLQKYPSSEPPGKAGSVMYRYKQKQKQKQKSTMMKTTKVNENPLSTSKPKKNR